MRLAARRRPDVLQAEPAQHPVVGRLLPLTLQHDDVHCGLVVLRRREDLRAPYRDRRVPLDHLSHDATHRLQTQRQRRDVQQEDVRAFAGQHRGLNRRAQRDDLVGVDRHVRVLAAGKPPDQGLHGRDPGRATDEDHLIEVVRGDLRIRHRPLDRLQAPLDQVAGDLLERRPSDGRCQMFRARGVSGDERETDLGLGDRTQLDLGLLRSLKQPLQRLRVVTQVYSLVPLELLGQMVHEPTVEIVAAEMGVASRGSDLDNTVAHIEDAHVEGAPAQVEDQNGLVPLLVESVRQRGGRGLVDDAEHVQAGDLPGVLSRRALSVVEVGRHRDDSLGHLLAQELRRVVGELTQDQSADLLGRVELAFDVEADHPIRAGHHVEADCLRLVGHLVEATSDEPLGGVDRSLGIQDRLSAGQLTHQTFAALREGHNRRRRPRPFGVGYHGRLTTLHCGDH